MPVNPDCFRKLNIGPLSVPKESGRGNISYELLIDSHGVLFVRMLENSQSGTFSPLAFDLAALEKSLEDRPPTLVGTDHNGSSHEVADNNNMAFLRAVVRQLLEGST